MTYFDHDAPRIRIEGAQAFAPEPLATGTVLIDDGRISAIVPDATDRSRDREGDHHNDRHRETIEIDGSGKLLVPGFIDSHLHITGGGSIGAGPISREPEFSFGDIVAAGITTAIACQGADYISRSYEALLQKARALAAEGLSAFIWTNGFSNPATSLTESVATDLFLLPEVVGSKIAVADFLAPPWTPDELHRLLWQVLSGAQMSGKVGVVHAHAGVLPAGLRSLAEVIGRYSFEGVDETSRHGASRTVGGHFQITHCNWNDDLLGQTIELCRTGAYADVTAGMPDSHGFGTELPADESILTLLEAGISESQITVSSDAGGNESFLDQHRRVETLIRLIPPRIDEVFRKLVGTHGLPVSSAVRVTSTNVADLHGWTYKGRIFRGADADLVLLDAGTLAVDTVISSGRLVVQNGEVLHAGITAGREELYRRSA